MTRTIFERQPPPASVVDHSLRDARLQSFWIDDLGTPTRYPGLTAPAHYDLVVVGGGYAGLWSALMAVQRTPGITVAVLEGVRVGWAASGRNGGFVEASLTHGADNGRSRWPQDMTVVEQLGRDNLDGIETTVRDLGMDCDFTRPGVLTVAVEDYQVGGLRETHLDGSTVYLDRGAVRAEVNSPTYLAGVWTRDDSALVHPAKLAAELARTCSDRGVDIYENTTVRSIDPGRAEAPVALYTDSAAVTADRVILATNAFPSLLKRYRYHTVPVYDYVLMTEPLSREQLSSIGWHNRQGLTETSNQFHYYRLSADNRILWGGYDAIYHFGRRIDPRLEDRDVSYRKLASHFFTTFPQLEGLSFTHRWAGVIDTCTRFCAFFGTAGKGRIAYAAGFTGLGVAATRFAANVMLDHVGGQRTERTELAMVRSSAVPFPPEPLTWLGVNATRWSLDRADHQRGRRNLLLRGLDAAGLGFDS